MGLFSTDISEVAASIGAIYDIDIGNNINDEQVRVFGLYLDDPKYPGQSRQFLEGTLYLKTNPIIEEIKGLRTTDMNPEKVWEIIIKYSIHPIYKKQLSFNVQNFHNESIGYTYKIVSGKYLNPMKIYVTFTAKQRN